MSKRELTCICCPLGCNITVELIEGTIHSVTGNRCNRGDIYVRKELVSPTRIVTSSVRISNRASTMLSVKTASDIPKDKIFACMDAIKDLQFSAPVSIGDIVLKNVADTGVDLVATRTIL